MAKNTPTGAGVAALEKAAEQGKPVILVTGHYGNYEAMRACLVARGYDIGGLYRNMKNPYFNAHYVKTMEAFGGPVFPQGRRGTAGFVRHLKEGGQLVLLFDQHVFGAPALDFLGQPANTALSAAELALRYDALLIPFYGIRQADGVSFDTVLEAPVPHSDAVTMTQALNDSLTARVKARSRAMVLGPSSLAHPRQLMPKHLGILNDYLIRAAATIGPALLRCTSTTTGISPVIAAESDSGACPSH